MRLPISSAAVAIWALCCVISADAHAGMVSPVSRNSMDRTLPDFEGGKSPATPCTCANGYENEHPAAPNTTVITVADGQCWTDEGVNYNNHEHQLKVVKGMDAAGCCAACKAYKAEHVTCSFWTLTAAGDCYLKSADLGRTPLKGAISGGTGTKPPLPPSPGSCDLGVRKDGGEGQPCLWWSQGCSIGCDVCATNLTNGKIPLGPITGNSPKAGKAGFRKSYCANPKTNATLPREAWTMNIHVVEGSLNDSYRFNPWRAPGSAPVVDACGQAGGKYKQTQMGGDSTFTTTKFATMGDMGSQVLPKGPAMAHWQAGSAVQVSWGIRYNHGGGYQYRLCRADEELTESCFMRTPLEFDREKQFLVWNNGTRWRNTKAVFVDTGVVPANSTWAKNPIPRVNDDNVGEQDPASCPGPNGRSGLGCVQFPPPCPSDCTGEPGCTHGRLPWSTDGSGQGDCSGDWTAGVIEDTVLIPKDLPAGDYVLGWRW